METKSENTLHLKIQRRIVRKFGAFSQICKSIDRASKIIFAVVGSCPTEFSPQTANENRSLTKNRVLKL